MKCFTPPEIQEKFVVKFCWSWLPKGVGLKGDPTELGSGIVPGCEISFCPSKVLRRNQKKPKRVRKRKEKGKKQQQKKGRSPRKLLRKLVRRRRRRRKRRKRKKPQGRKRVKARRRLDLRAAFHQHND